MQASTNFIHTNSFDVQVNKFWRLNNVSAFDHDEQVMSRDDVQVVKLWENSIVHKQDNHYQLPTP